MPIGGAMFGGEIALPPATERERAHEIPLGAGMLTELSPELKRRAAQSSASLADVSAALSRASNEPLSDTIIAQRGPKE